MKRQILKTVACFVLVGCMSSVVMAELQASDGIDGYRTGNDFLNQGVSEIKSAIKGLDSAGSTLLKENMLDPNQIWKQGGDYLHNTKYDGSKGLFDIIDAVPGNFGVSGDQWLNEFYGNESNLNFDVKKYLGNNAGGTSDNGRSEFRDKVRETELRAGVARAIYDSTGIDNGDLWMEKYVPALELLKTQYVDKADAAGISGKLVNSQNTLADVGKSVQDFTKMGQDFSMTDANNYSNVVNDMINSATQEVTNMDPLRLINAEAMRDMNNQNVPEGGGIPTMDILNIVVGLYNVDSVYGMFDQNATGGTGADQKKQSLGVQVAEYKSCITSGKEALECCQIISEAGEAGVRGAVKQKDCCMVMTGNQNCTPMVQQQKKDCLKNLKDASGWVTCDVKCKGTDFGDLIHKKMENGETKWDESLIDDLLEECGVGESDWVPSPTVLTSAELAAVVPETIKKELVGKK